MAVDMAVDMVTEDPQPEAREATDNTENTQPAQPPEAAPRRSERRRPGGEGLASLVGGGGSQVGTNGAMRARDVSRPR